MSGRVLRKPAGGKALDHVRAKPRAQAGLETRPCGLVPRPAAVYSDFGARPKNPETPNNSRGSIPGCSGGAFPAPAPVPGNSFSKCGFVKNVFVSETGSKNQGIDGAWSAINGLEVHMPIV